MMKLTKFALLISSLSLSSLAFANAPVVDLSQADPIDPVQSIQTQAMPAAVTDNSSLPMDQRVGRLEQQLSNITQMNMPARIDQLQQQVNQLQGQLAEQNHQLQTMQDQQKSFYADLTQQISALKTAPNISSTGKVSAANTTTAAPASANEQASYQNAFNALAAKKYDQAVSGFQAYLQQYPNGQYVSNSHYWLGEIYFLQNKTDLASAEFQTILKQYPKDQKVPDAMLKLAFINDNSGKKDLARQQLQQIVKQYPGTPAAQLASLRLKA